MTVIINELEVIVDAPDTTRSETGDQPASKPSTNSVSTEDIFDVAERQARVIARLAAH